MSEIILRGKELDRLLIMNRVKNKDLTMKEAGILLGLSCRQVGRLKKRIESMGNEGVHSLNKGGNRRIKEELRVSVVEILKNPLYEGFGPTLMSEYLKEKEGIRLSREKVRQMMMEEGLWKGRARRKARIHQSRERRPRFGELVQIDGSYHRWFEDRGTGCCLLVAVDDATSKIIGLRFCESETTLDYMALVKEHLERFGRPITYYCDRHSIFKTTRQNSADGRVQDTQFKRALGELGIELICANSPQAKGRVERANQTLQDRLIKWMRIQKIVTMEEANKCVDLFIQDYNGKFGVVPEKAFDAHRPLNCSGESLENSLSIQTSRKLSKNLEFSFENQIYQIQTKTKGYRLRQKNLKVCGCMDGGVKVFDQNELLAYKVIEKSSKTLVVDYKNINCVVDGFVQDSHLKEVSG